LNENVINIKQARTGAGREIYISIPNIVETIKIRFEEREKLESFANRLGLGLLRADMT
jgi:hypothetical protein